MAQDLGLDFTDGPTVTTLLGSDLGHGDRSAVSTVINLGNPAPFGLSFDWKQVCASGAVNLAFLEIVWSIDGTNFSEVTKNFDTITSMDCLASVTVNKIGAFQVKAQYFKFQILNESGGVLTASGSTVTLKDIYGDQV